MTFVTRSPIDLTKILEDLTDPSCGAMALFIGTVRNHNEGKRVKKLYYECYEAMAEKQIEMIVNRVKKDHDVHDIHVEHRIGSLEVGDMALVIAVTSAHRDETFRACRTVLEAIKKTVPVWKKEVYEDGTSEWIKPHVV